MNKYKTIEVKATISLSSFLFALDEDEETINALVDKIAESWDYTKELDVEYVRRISLHLTEKIKEKKQRFLNYGGSPAWNMEYCEKELKAGRKVNRNKLSNSGN